MNPHWDEVVAVAKKEAAEAERRRAQGTEMRPDGDTDLKIGDEQYKTLRFALDVAAQCSNSWDLTTYMYQVAVLHKMWTLLETWGGAFW